ncbi:tyrosine-type recombinase/integrase, partial [Parabacteroides distasonis]|uniref:tyrosine-type recombinase/integrase n=1 Tax=Parabacteroides distasonis TaxID=823 RepID=UPI0032BF9350
NGYKILSFQTYKAVCLIPQVYRVSPYAEYNGALLRFNRALRSLAETCGVGEPVTSYTIRHSFATTLKEQDVPIEMISELLGHTSIKTTQIYLKSFSLERLSAVNRACFESVYKPVSEVG